MSRLRALGILLAFCAGPAAADCPIGEATTIALEHLRRIDTVWNDSPVPDAWRARGNLDDELDAAIRELDAAIDSHYLAMKTALESCGESGIRAVAEILEQNKKVHSDSICLTIFSLAIVGFEHPDLVMELLLDAMPFEERSIDLCAVEGMVTLGPAAYPMIYECSLKANRASAYWCLVALLEQSQQIAGLFEDLGLVDVDGDPTDPPSRRKAIRKLARRWKVWWEQKRDDVIWDSETNTLHYVEGAIKSDAPTDRPSP